MFSSLVRHIATGTPALDVLLGEKISYARQNNKTKPDITITVKPCHQFLLVEVTNSAALAVDISYGTGLTNIRRTVDKYQGSIELEQTGGRFRLSVLLCLAAGDTRPNTKQD